MILAVSAPLSTVSASGFTIPGQGARSISRGGAIVALADDLSALMNNPGGLSKLYGTHLLINHNTAIANSAFTRGASVIGDMPTGYQARTEVDDPVFAKGLALAVSTDATTKDWTFAFGVYGPNAVGDINFSPEGGQRYLVTEQEMLLMYFTLGAAYGGKNWGVGATFQRAWLPKSKFTQIIDGAVDDKVLPEPYQNDFDTLATLDLASEGSWTGQIGAWYRPIDAIEIGFSARIVPIFLHLEGDVILEPAPYQAFPGGDPTTVNTTGTVDLTLPIILRSGIRYRHMSGDRELFDIEIDYIFEAWSVLDKYDIDLEGEVHLQGGAIKKPLQDIVLDKAWQDTHSVRIGGSYNAIENVFSVSLGGLWESAAAPLNYSNLDFPSFERFGVGGGIRLQGYGLDFNLGVMHIFSETREVDELFGKQFSVRPLAPCPDKCQGVSPTAPKGGGIPVNNGIFEQSYTQITASIGVHFNEWF